MRRETPSPWMKPATNSLTEYLSPERSAGIATLSRNPQRVSARSCSPRVILTRCALPVPGTAASLVASQCSRSKRQRRLNSASQRRPSSPSSSPPFWSPPSTPLSLLPAPSAFSGGPRAYLSSATLRRLRSSAFSALLMSSYGVAPASNAVRTRARSLALLTSNAFSFSRRSSSARLHGRRMLICHLT